MNFFHCLNALMISTMLMHVVFSPYTKVEESFNIQAMHDIIYHTTNLSKYDHYEFPGVVPRTFFGPLFIGAISYPVVVLLKLVNASKIYSQLVCRCVLGLLTSLGLIMLSTKLRGQSRIFYLLFTCSQFHLLFYSSRTLPNVFALILVLYAITSWLRNNNIEFIWASAFAIIIFRAELSVLMGLLLLWKLYDKKVSFKELLLNAALAGPIALACTVFVDSYFWNRWLWPEAEVFYYNTVLNKSSLWGTLPFTWYFRTAIPKALFFTTPFLFVPLVTSINRDLRQLYACSLLFVLAYSCLPHKESRFIMYVYPIFNMVAAEAAMNIWQWAKNRGFSKYLLTSTFCGVLLGNVCLTAVATYVSNRNYSGGEAFALLHELNKNQGDLAVHITNAAAQTGVTRFGELNHHWRYNKSESFDWRKQHNHGFTHLVVESPCLHVESVQGVVEGFSSFLLKKSFPFFQVLLEPKLCVLKVS